MRHLIACLLAFAALVVPAHAASLDTSFGTDGRLVLGFGGGTNASAGDLAIQPDAKILAAGWVNGAVGVARLLPSGKLDPSFGTEGIALPNFGSAAQSGGPPRIALQPDGAIVVTGPAVNAGGSMLIKYDFGVMRLTPDGALDPSFGQGGRAYFQVGDGTEMAQDVAIQPDGKIVLAGWTATKDGSNSDFAAVRLTPTGGLDTGFGNEGTAVIPMVPDSGMESASAVGLLPGGQILLAGVVARPGTGFDLAAVRLTKDGHPDAAFGQDGRTELALGTGAWQEIVRSLLVLPDGSFYISGSALQPGFGPSQVALTHFTASGVADRQVLQPLGTIEDTSSGIVLDGATVYLAVDSRRSSFEREVGVLAFDGEGSLLFHITADGNDRAADLVQRADGTLIEFATVRPPDSANDAWGFAAIMPRSTRPVEPPPPDTTPIEQPVAPVSAILAPKAHSKPHRVTTLRGSASGRLGVERVDIALVRRVGRTCFYLRSTKPTFAAHRLRRASSKCTQLIWHRASGTTTWRYKLRKPLPKGVYALYSRAGGSALIESPPKRVDFTVR